MPASVSVTAPQPVLVIVNGEQVNPFLTGLRCALIGVGVPNSTTVLPPGMTTCTRGVVEVTVMLKPQVVRLPAGVVITQLTGVVPIGKLAPGGGVQTTVVPCGLVEMLGNG